MSILYILCGLPGAGKSHWSNQKCKDSLTVIVSRDSFRNMIKGDNYIFDHLYEKTIKESSNNTIKEFLKDGFDVIADETNFSKRRRKELIDLVSDLNVKIVAVYFKDMDTLENRLNDPRGYSKEKWIEVINNMKNNFEVPKLNEGIDRIITIEPWRK